MMLRTVIRCLAAIAITTATQAFAQDPIMVGITPTGIPLTFVGIATEKPTGAMVDLASALTGERVGWELVFPGADGLSDDDAALTGRPAGEPAMTLDATGISRTGTVCYWTREVHLRGAFRYAMVRRADW